MRFARCGGLVSAAFCAAMFAGSVCAAAAAAEPADKKPADRAATEPAKTDLRVAVLDFASDTPASPELGKQISEVVVANLSGVDGVTLLDRSTLARTLQEHELNLSGVVEPSQATKIGKLAGAQILITGKAFPVDKQVYLTAKMIGTETSLVEAIMVKGPEENGIDKLMLQLSEKIVTRLREKGPRLVADLDREVDPVPALKQKLSKLKRPALAVSITERHVAGPTPAARVDPAVETEVRMLLKECGFTVVEGDERQLAEGGVALTVGGEAFSEFGARIGNLVSCAARAEMKVSDRKTGEIVFTHRDTSRGVDLSENLAGKNALQKAGRVLGVRLLEYFAQSLPPAAAANADAAAKSDAK